MSSIKLVAGGTVVDAIKNPCYVIYVDRLGLFLACPEATAQGVASRKGTTYWHLEGCPEFGVDGYLTVSAVSISDEEADALIEALDAGEEPMEPDPDPNPIDPPEEHVMSIQEMREAIIQLQKASGSGSENYATKEDVQAVWDSMAAAIQEGVVSA